MERVWIGIGSNLNDPIKQVDQAIFALSNLPCTRLLACSSYYRSQPLGDIDQPNFLNLVIILETSLQPKEFLYFIQHIENKQGRIRSSSVDRWGPRTLDLDILLFGAYIINTTKLVVPHYDMIHREFVVYPLIELDPNLIIPNKISLKKIIRTLPKKGLTFWNV